MAGLGKNLRINLCIITPSMRAQACLPSAQVKAAAAQVQLLKWNQRRKILIVSMGVDRILNADFPSSPFFYVVYMGPVGHYVIITCTKIKFFNGYLCYPCRAGIKS